MAARPVSYRSSISLTQLKLTAGSRLQHFEAQPNNPRFDRAR